MLEQFLNQPLAITPKAARDLFNSLAMNSKKGVKLFDQDGQVSDAEKIRVTEPAAYLGGVSSHSSKPFHFVDGIAVIPVNGLLVHRLGYISSYATGYNTIVARFDAANNDPDVKGILFVCNSPGGHVAGCFDACDHIFESKGAKPVWSIYDDKACSGAMCIGSVADRRFTTQTAHSGSIGVVMSHVSYEGMLKDNGLDVTLIYSGSHKVDGNPYENLPDQVYEEFKAECDDLRLKFAEKVARNIGLSVEQVLETEAKSYTGQEAVDAGLADEVINSHNIISHFKQHLSGEDSQTQRSVTMSEQTTQEASVSESAGTEQANQAQVTAPQEEGAQVDQQARCKAIIGCEAATGRKELASHLAFDTQLSVEESTKILESAPLATASADSTPLDQAMAATEQPEIGAMSDDAEASEADQFVQSYKTITGAE